MMGPNFALLVLVCSLVVGEEILVSESSNNLRRAIDKKHENVTGVSLNSRSLEEVLEIWNPRRVANLWNEIQSRVKVDGPCENDIVRYFVGILKSELWALQMMDASGKYTWGLLSSNNFWTGFPDQCRELEKMFTKKERHEEEMHSKVPPFPVAVYSVKMNLTILESSISGKHQVVLGLCLPKRCTARDVESLLKVSTNLSQTENLPRKIKFDAIRNLSTSYSVWEDKTFYIILVAFLVVTVFTVIGTLYDVFLRCKFLNISNSQKETDLIHDFKYTSKSNWKENVTLKSIWSVKHHNGSFDVSNSKEVPKPFSEALLSFSLLLNLSKMGSFSAGNDTLTPIHGLRFLSMLWIILVHTCLIVNEVSDSSLLRSEAESDFLYQTLSNGTYGVDTFFVISGCLVSFLYFRTIEKETLKAKKITQGGAGKVMQFLGMISYRYFRLTPPYLAVLGINQVAVKWIHENLMIEFGQNDAETCPKFWWRNALYVNTYFPMEERCMVWSWYLANDTQFYTVGIIILIIAASYFKVAAAIVAVFLVASWITTAVITLHTKHIPTITNPFAHYESLYDKPWTRIGPYLIGMSVGWYLYKVKCKVNMHKVVKLIGWIISYSAMASIVYGIYGMDFGPVSSAMYTALSHSGWAISIGWILIACVTNNSGIVNGILSWKYIYPLSRLTYCAYLVHPAILRLMVLRGESSLHLTRGLMAIFFFGTVVASYAASLLLSLLFEAPMVSLLRIVHPMRVWRQTWLNENLRRGRAWMEKYCAVYDEEFQHD